ncbi:MAG: S8 family serine peptidase [Armatimonadota bacterium]|jgi:subtilisin family serine protease
MKKHLLVAIVAAQVWMIVASAQGAPIRFRVRTIDPTGPKMQIAIPMRDAGLFAIQFKNVITPEWKAQLESLGVAIVGYVPENTLLVRLKAGQLADVKALPFVYWTGHISADLKIEPELLECQWDYVNVVIKLTSAGDAQEVVEQLQRLGATGISIPTESTTILRATVQPASLLQIADIDEVQWIEEWIQPKPTNNVSGQITTVIPTREQLGIYGEGQIIAIADTGLDTGSLATLHPDFAGRLVKSYALRRAGDWSDLIGHGTHVAGIAAGSGAQSGSNPAAHEYETSFAGMAPEAGIIFQSIGDGSGNVFPPMNLDQLFSPVYADGARVHNNSWGSPAYGKYTVYAQQLDEFVWAHKDFVAVFPAGNDGADKAPADGVVDPGSLYTPATAKNCIAVGATESDRNTGRATTYGSAWRYDFPKLPISNDYISDNPNGMVAWSSRGPCEDGRIKPDICAPGSNIISVRSHRAMNYGWLPYDTDYVYWGGTSMAAPLVSGAAALVREYCIKNRAVNPSAALVKAMLMNGATDLFPGQYGDATSATREIRTLRPDRSEGWGRINLSNTLEPAAPRVVDFVDETAGISTGDERQYQYTVIDGSLPLAVTLAWTDYPGELLAAQELVNDLDLTVIGPNGTSRYYGNGTFGDSINNVETVDVPTPVAGTYTVKVKGHNVPCGPQPYALVVSAKLPGSYIAGRLTTASGKPIASATVTVNDGVSDRTVSTDGNGSYTIHLSPGNYTVTPDKPQWQFSPASRQVLIGDHGESGVDFAGSANSGGISGTVTCAAGGMTNYILESPHPYDLNCNLNYTVQAHPSATQIRLHFSEISVLEGYDFIVVSTPDQSQIQYISGEYSDLWSDWFDGNSLVVQLVAYGWDNDWGFYIDGLETDVITQGGVDGVEITAEPYDISATTQNGGQYVIPDLEPVSYTLSLSKPHWDFRPATASVSVPPGQGGTGSITLPGTDFLAFAPASLGGEVLTGDVRSFSDNTASEHPYYDDWDEMWTISYAGEEPCSRIRVHFSKIDMEDSFDFVQVLTPDGEIVHTYTGSYPDGIWSDWVQGNELRIRLTSDETYSWTNSYWGFAVDEYMIAGNERPLANVRVGIESGQAAMTDSDGKYLITNVGAGEYYGLIAQKPCFEIDPPLRYLNAISGMTSDGGDFFAVPQKISSAGVVKTLADSSPVTLEGLVVTAGAPRYTNFFYVESPDRTSGIRVIKQQHGLQVGSKVNVYGALATLPSGERAIVNPSVDVVGTGAVVPVGMSSRQLGGSNWLYDPISGAGQVGIFGSIGLNNIGMLVTIWGKVTHSNLWDDYFYIDDGGASTSGSDPRGVRIEAAGLEIPEYGCYVSVTGISSCEMAGGHIVSRLLVRGQSDIKVQDVSP